jgi:hypothetical protein
MFFSKQSYSEVSAWSDIIVGSTKTSILKENYSERERANTKEVRFSKEAEACIIIL